MSAPGAAGRITKADFQTALSALKARHLVAREGWNGKDMWLELQVPDMHSKMSSPYIYMKTADNFLVPWVPSQTDLMAHDWQVVR